MKNKALRLWIRAIQAARRLAISASLGFFVLGTARADDPHVDPKDLPRVPPTEASGVEATFQVKPGFRMDLVASEPLVIDPIAMCFDEHGRLYVVEMRDYSERRPERLGRIRRLVDTDGDGRYDQSTVFVDGLAWPTAVICHGGGVFVGATPDIFFCKDEDGDGIADTRELIFTGFASDYAPYETNKLNVQAMLNTFAWGLDNRIHGATGGSGGKIHSIKRAEDPVLDVRGRDFSFDPRTYEMRAESGGAQHGLSFDDVGNKFVSSNSDHIQQVLYEDRYGGRNPQFAPRGPRVSIAAEGPAAEVYRISPDEPWRVLRTRWRVAGLVPGPVEGGGRPSGYFTGATGVTLYRGDAWPQSMRGDAFIGDCGSNLIHRKRLLNKRIGRLAERPPGEERMEFVASTDNWFRPVQFANAPDGTLYVADMYRETIEHPWSIPASLKKHLDLNSGNDRGRIYRIVPEGYKQPKPVRLGALTAKQWVALLEHPNGWHRDTAARLLCERRDGSVLRDLERLFEKSPQALGRLHGLYVMSTLGLLREKHVFAGLGDPDPDVRRHAARLSEDLSSWNGRMKGGETVLSRLAQLAVDPEPAVRYQAAFTYGIVPLPDKTSLLATLAIRDAEDPWFRLAILSSLREGALELFERVAADSQLVATSGGQEFLRQLAQVVGSRNQAAELESAVKRVVVLPVQNQVLTLADALWSGAEGAGADRSRLAALFKPVLDQARNVVQNSSLPEPTRLAAIRVAGRGRTEDFQAPLLALIGPSFSDEIQGAALSAVVIIQGAASLKPLLERWGQLTPRQRQSVLEAAVRRSELMIQVAEGLALNLLGRGDLTAAQWERLSKSGDPRVRDALAKWVSPEKLGSRVDTFNRYEAALQLSGNTGRGKAIFLQRCLACHRAGAEGGNTGPDLASVRSNGKESILRNMIDPNLVVAPQYAAYEVQRKDDETFTGVIASEGETSLILRGADGKEITLPRAQIRSLKALGQSLMPEGLEAGLSVQEMADLLEFVFVGN